MVAMIWTIKKKFSSLVKRMANIMVWTLVMLIGSVGGKKKGKKEMTLRGKTDLHKCHHASCGTKEPVKLEFVQRVMLMLFSTSSAKVLKPQALLELIIAWRDNMLSVHCNLSEGKRILSREF